MSTPEQDGNTQHQDVNNQDQDVRTRESDGNIIHRTAEIECWYPPTYEAPYSPSQKLQFVDLPIDLVVAIACAAYSARDAARLLRTNSALHNIWLTHLKYITKTILRKCYLTYIVDRQLTHKGRTLPAYDQLSEFAVLNTEIGVDPAAESILAPLKPGPTVSCTFKISTRLFKVTLYIDTKATGTL